MQILIRGRDLFGDAQSLRRDQPTKLPILARSVRTRTPTFISLSTHLGMQTSSGVDAMVVGDGGYCVVNWANPNLVLVFANGTVYRSTSRGTSELSWSSAKRFPWYTMTQPIVTPRYNPANPTDANLVALGDGPTVLLSQDFANTWPMQFTLPGGVPDNDVFALAFASRNRIFVGTTLGQVFKSNVRNRSADQWTLLLRRAKLESRLTGWGAKSCRKCF
jgi:hypothetical protein